MHSPHIISHNNLNDKLYKIFRFVSLATLPQCINLLTVHLLI